MKRLKPYKHPTTYYAIVEHANQAHARRIAELKQAAKYIIAIERDLDQLAAQGIFVDVGEYSMHLRDCRPSSDLSGRSQWALRIATGIFSETSDRAVRAFLALGWIVERIDSDTRYANLLLRRPKTRSRVLLDCSAKLAQSLQPQGAR